MEQDIRYKQAKIYKIVCNITGEIYYGSTIQTLQERLMGHKKTRKSCISRNIIDRGDYKIELIKDYPCNSKKELELEETKYIREINCINKNLPCRTPKEYYEDNKKEILEKLKNYYEDNKDKKDKKIEYQIEYYEKNKEKILEYHKEYYEENKKEINKKASEKIECECGAIVRKSDIARHKKTLKHIKLSECLIID